MSALAIASDVPLAPRTTLELGGSARFLCEAKGDDDVRDALAWAAQRSLRVLVLGGGSNLIVRDEGWDGLVLAMATRGIERTAVGDVVHVSAAAGENWDAFVASCVAEGLAGLECLAGIPGLVGATPVQNVGAYGQEVSDTIVSVRALERASGDVVELSPADCAFAYRDSALKREPERFVVLGVTFALRPGGAPTLRYAELERALEGEEPSLARTREIVIALRRRKSMVIDASDPNRRSAGSFFTNPIVDGSTADAVVSRAIALGVVSQASEVPRWLQPDGRVKLTAGWLVERAGMHKGLRRGAVGISSAHALALVHHRGGTTGELLALAAEVVAAVHDRFGVTLEREPVLV